MGVREDVKSEVKDILDWDLKVTEYKDKVPEKADLTTGKTAIKLTTCVLYVDMRGSSNLADSHRSTTAAKVYNAYLNAMVRVAKSRNGRVRSFNGDSILVFFDPSVQLLCDQAVETALEMQLVADEIIKPAIRAKTYEEDFNIGVGVTYGTLLVTKAGLRGDENNSDLIWPCTPVNMAARLGDTARPPWGVYIHKDVHARISDHLKYTKGFLGIRIPLWAEETLRFAGTNITAFKRRTRQG